MKVLIACEFSGIVRDAFAARGHDAWSCDLLETERPGQHIVGDCREILRRGWDLMIAHPPCTYLCNSGIRWLYKGGKKANGRDYTRWGNMHRAARFFNTLLDAPIRRIAVENPRMHIYGLKHCGEETQSIFPERFGEAESKETCLWLRRLPRLVPTGHEWEIEHRVHHIPPGPNRWKERSRTLQGIANAMAEQWG